LHDAEALLRPAVGDQQVDEAAEGVEDEFASQVSSPIDSAEERATNVLEDASDPEEVRDGRCRN